MTEKKKSVLQNSPLELHYAPRYLSNGHCTRALMKRRTNKTHTVRSQWLLYAMNPTVNNKPLLLLCIWLLMNYKAVALNGIICSWPSETPQKRLQQIKNSVGITLEINLRPFAFVIHCCYSYCCFFQFWVSSHTSFYIIVNQLMY